MTILTSSSKSSASKAARGSKRKQRYATYREAGKALINKNRRLARHLKKHPNDTQSREHKKAVFPVEKKIPNIERPLDWFYKKYCVVL